MSPGHRMTRYFSSRGRLGGLILAAVSTAVALVLTRVFWQQFQSTPFLLSFTAVVLSSRLGGREAGFAAVVFGVVWYTAFPPPLHGTSYVGLLVGFTLISTAFSWIVAKHSEIADALRASESRLAVAQQVANVGSFEWNLRDGTFTWSDQVYRILGVAMESVVPTFDNLSRFVHPDDREMVQRVVQQAIADRQPFASDARIVTPGGEIRTVHAQGRVVVSENPDRLLMIGTIQDVTERTLAEQAVLRSEQRLKTMIDAEPACVKLVSADGTLLDMNAAGLQMLGARDLSELAGHPVTDVVHPQHRHRFLEAHQAASSGSPARLEFQIVGLQGSERWVDAHMVPFDVGSGEPGGQRGVLSVTSDVTDRKQLEEQFRQAQKMEAVGRLAGGIAHDFNNLLTVIGGMTQMALERIPDDSPAAADLREARKASQSAAALTRQLLLFSRKQATPMVPVDLNGVIANIKELLRRAIGEDILVKIRLSPDLRRVRGDSAQLQQVLMNLAVNARDAMPRGGVIEIETDRVLLDERTAQNLALSPGQYVTLTFADNGHGMDPETQARIFEPFFTTKERGRGTGLGLASVYGIVQTFGGSITVNSEVGRGTTFKLYFPETAAAAAVTESHPASDVETLTGNETIVLVEDDERVRAFSARVLRSAGYTVIEAAAPGEALQILQHDGANIDALLTDIIMPEMDGCELARRVRTESPGTRVLFMSGYTDQVFEEHNVSVAEESLLEKPFTAPELLRKLRDVLGPGTSPVL